MYRWSIRRRRAAAAHLIAAAATWIGVFSAPDATAYPRYNSGCQTCHGAFGQSPYQSPRGGAAWPDSLHEVHRGGSFMGADCNLCHTTGDTRDPYTNLSNGTATAPGYGCVGCHGGVYAGAPRGPGLRAHHERVRPGACYGCHPSDPAPHAESVAPPYYGLPDSGVAFPCDDDDAESEDWSGDHQGLDNDGDGLYDGADPDCGPTCGDGVVGGGETCDPPASCPASCDDGDDCTADSLSGAAASCDVRCSHAAVQVCVNGDGCCPGDCDATNDDDCAARCGNGVVEPGETCDPPGSCPTCDDGDDCTADSLSGGAASCDVLCSHSAVEACVDGDGCCPDGCDGANDDDCPAVCGNGVVEPGETCDPPGSCPAGCDDGDPCTADTLSGAAASCDVGCAADPLTACVGDDGCCPAGCTWTEDADCSAACGDGVVGAGETCDPPSSCPTSCEDPGACRAPVMTGAAEACNVACSSTVVSDCRDGDGCCPAGCDATVDADCAARCGNGTVEPGETCDPPGSCPGDCDDGDACTVDSAVGDPATCDAACVATAIEACAAGDGCCPPECDAATDADCSPACGDGQVGEGETCDPPESCPAACDDGNACTRDARTGSAENCNATCRFVAIVGCADGDGCCPAGCGPLTDADCSVTCGDGVVAPGETCDPPESCPAACDDGEACTQDLATGSAANCNVACRFDPIYVCVDDDGCCPQSCNRFVDTDCAAAQDTEEVAQCSPSGGGAPGALVLLALLALGLVGRRSGRRLSGKPAAPDHRP